MDARSSVAPTRAGKALHRFANPGQFLRLSGAILPWLFWTGGILTAFSLVWGLFFAPDDWQQGDTVRIMYVHVPFAWLASAGYLSLAACSVLSLVWRHPLADLAAVEIGPVGAGFTAVCLATGSLWGKPTWGAWWVWDAQAYLRIRAVSAISAGTSRWSAPSMIRPEATGPARSWLWSG